MSKKTDRIKTEIGDETITFKFHASQLTEQDIENSAIDERQKYELRRFLGAPTIIGEVKFREIDEESKQNLLIYGIKQWVNDGAAKSKEENPNPADHIFSRINGAKSRIDKINSGDVKLNQSQSISPLIRWLKNQHQFSSLNLQEIQDIYDNMPAEKKAEFENIFQLTQNLSIQPH